MCNCHSKHDKLKSGIKNGSQVNLNLSSDVFGDSNEETNILHKLLLASTQISKIHKALKFKKTQLYKMVKLLDFLVDLLNHY